METAVSNNETIVDALALRIRTYKKEHPNLSGAQIARRFNMTSSSLNRIENGDVRVPTIDQVLKVLRGTGASGDILKYLDANYPSIAETYREVYDTRNTEFISQDLECHLNDKDKFLIILLALTGDGTTREEVLCEFGRKGLSELEYLLEKGHLVEEDGVIGKNDKILNTSFETLKNLISLTAMQCLKTDKCIENINYLHFKSVGVKDLSVLKRIRGILSDAEAEVAELLNDPNNLGSERIFLGMVSDTLLDDYPTKGRMQ
ncbi:helix-turn-helix domain-containing protein [Halobacteriovorax marinus]|uniref:helix-turn-helix domain-containing protein n=1 Tax=Halobacteriovorax marinus TaxID=97084 RepID=UPI0012FE0711|nr:helix-turn-helix transcriptional regulator [Halobacteriovorax marinus]